MRDLLCLHGFAACGAVFEDLAFRLPEKNIIAPDLPGHGAASFPGFFDLEAIVDNLADGLTAPVDVLGWSLGGLLALLLAARHPQYVRSLVLVSAFAKYRQAPGYEVGVKKPTLMETAAYFRQNFVQGIVHFLALETLYLPQERPFIDNLRLKMTAHGTPAGLQAAQQAVVNADIRAALPYVTAPTLLLYGGKDRLTPPAMGQYLAAHLHQARLEIFAKSVHMPFYFEAERSVALFREFWQEDA